MLKQFVMAGAVAGLCAGTAVGAQSPATGAGQAQDPAQTRPAEQREARMDAQGATTTLTGCVYREQAIAGRTPNVAERAGVLEDYILADVKTGGAAAAPEGTPGAVGTSGTTGAHAMYKLELENDERLSAMVGKRVEVTGRIDADDAASSPAGSAGTTPERDRSLGPDQIELAEFEVTSIKAVEGTCPASPAQQHDDK